MKHRIFFLTALFVFCLDQLSKYCITVMLPRGTSAELLPHLLWLTTVHNRGAAFSLLQGQTTLLIATSVLAMGIVLWLYLQSNPTHRLMHLGLGCILGGSFGNLLDRVRLGYVVDFIDLGWWPVFNFADTLINIGIGLVLCHFLVTRLNSTKQPTPHMNGENRSDTPHSPIH